MPQIFQPVKPPTGQPESPDGVAWYTWSDDFRRAARELVADCDVAGTPPLIRINGLGKYNRTYSLPVTLISKPALRSRFTAFVSSLYVQRLAGKLMFFDRLMDGLTGAQLRVLIAIMRSVLADLAGNERAAMYAPLSQTGRSEKDFPLHADLYVPQFLFNVFDEVPLDDSGASVFLSFESLKLILADLRTMPTRYAREIVNQFEKETGKDRFTRTFSLLHGMKHPWVEDLNAGMRARQFRLKMKTGQGYLLHDRSWLHGRDLPRGGVSVNRVHRLVFNNRWAATQAPKQLTLR